MTPRQSEIDVSVCIPVYNEREAVRHCVAQLIDVMQDLPYTSEIIVIDDASNDGSMEEIRDLPVRVLRHRRNLGGGTARLTGLRYARGRWILQTDSDGTYPVDRVPAMLARMQQGADMVIGARLRESATDWRWLRVLMKWLLKSLASRLARYSIPDLNSGMRVYDRNAALQFAYLYPRGHSIMSTMTLAFVTNGLIVQFEPIEYNVRTGRSTFRPIGDTYNYLITIIRAMTYFDPLRIFVPPALLLFVAGMLMMVRNYLTFAALGFLPPLLFLGALMLFTVAVLSDQFASLAKALGWPAKIAMLDSLVEEVAPSPAEESGRGTA
jgi:glycosyltransferase involved in cell wall biosynthesis